MTFRKYPGSHEQYGPSSVSVQLAFHPQGGGSLLQSAVTRGERWNKLRVGNKRGRGSFL